MPSITALTKSVNDSISKKLGSEFTTSIEVFKGGKGFSSYVEIEVSRGDNWGCYTFYANGVCMIGNRKYSGDTFKEMKAKFLIDFKKDFQ